MLEVMLKSFDTFDETRVFEKGILEIVRIGGMMLGRASCEPGWRWSEHVSPNPAPAAADIRNKSREAI